MDLLEEIAQRYQLRLRLSERLRGGDECEIWSASAGDRACIIRISPSWRSPVQLQWTHDLMLSIQGEIPEVVAPLRARDGSTLFSYQGRPAALYPFIPGKALNREDPVLREQAASWLARLHLSLLHSPTANDASPAFGQVTPARLPPVNDPTEISDAALDAWHTALLDSRASFTIGPIHGDYYRRNLLVDDGRIRGVIDWDDAHIDFLMQETAWSAWEMCKTPAGDDWYLDRARRFFEIYRFAGGPVRQAEFSSAISFIRWRMREEIRLGLASAAAGEPTDTEYTQSEIRAFHRLQGQTVDS